MKTVSGGGTDVHTTLLHMHFTVSCWEYRYLFGKQEELGKSTHAHTTSNQTTARLERRTKRDEKWHTMNELKISCLSNTTRKDEMLQSCSMKMQPYTELGRSSNGSSKMHGRFCRFPHTQSHIGTIGLPSYLWALQQSFIVVAVYECWWWYGSRENLIIGTGQQFLCKGLQCTGFPSEQES
jgi:hypothetical protein